MVLSFKAAVEGDTKEAAKPQFDCEVGRVSERPHASPFSLYFNLQ